MENKSNNNYIIKFKSYTFIVCVISTALFMLFWQNGDMFYEWTTGKKIYMILGAACILMQFFVLPCKKAFIAFFLYLPNIQMFKFSQGGNTVLSIGLLIIGIKYFLRYENLKFPLSIAIYLTSTFIFLFVSDNIRGITSDFRFALDIFLFISFLDAEKSEKGSIKNLTQAITDSYIKGCILMVASAVIYPIIYGKQYMRFVSIANDANYFAVILNIAIIICAFYIAIFEHNELLCLVSIFLFAIVGLLSLSRTFFLILIVESIFVAYLLHRHSPQKARRYMKYLVLLLVILLLIFSDKIFTIVENILLRFANPINAGGGGRYELWAWYIKKTFESTSTILFGLGDVMVFLKSGLIDSVQHSIFVELFSTKGLLGTVFYVGYFISAITVLKKLCGPSIVSIISLIPVLVVLAGYATLNAMHSDYFVFQLLIAVVCGIMYSNLRMKSNSIQGGRII